MTPSKAPLPLLGTWKLTDTETSRPDLPYPSEGTITFAQGEDGIHFRNEHVWSDGRTAIATAVLQLDGGWYPLTGSLMNDAMSMRQLPDGSFEGKMSKGGADTGINHTIVSANGRTMTSRWEMAIPGSAPVVWNITAERQ